MSENRTRREFLQGTLAAVSVAGMTHAKASGATASFFQEDGIDKEVFEEPPYSWGTNWGETVDLCAPGSTTIITTNNGSRSDYSNDFGGTSAAAAFVSGTA